MSLGSFRAPTQRLHHAVMSEFGNSHADESAGAEPSREAVVSTDADMPAGMTKNDIALIEIQSGSQDAVMPMGPEMPVEMEDDIALAEIESRRQDVEITLQVQWRSISSSSSCSGGTIDMTEFPDGMIPRTRSTNPV
jgi:hypothetical protein